MCNRFCIAEGSMTLIGLRSLLRGYYQSNPCYNSSLLFATLTFDDRGSAMSTFGPSKPGFFTIIDSISNTKSDAANAVVSPVLS
jgi:hypothetical protein